MAGQLTRETYRTQAVWSALLFAALICWIYTIRDARMMGNMPGTMGMGAVSFLVMWTVMMAAMMLPALAPIAGLYLRVLSGQSRGAILAARIGAFVTGYLLVWAVIGLAAYGCARLLDQDMRVSPLAATWSGAGVLIACGLYQFTPLKYACLRHCRSPLGFLMQFGSYTGRLRDLRVGLYHGAWCTGCCVGLMLVMIITGVMNVTWMITLALIIFIEKVWRYGREFSALVGILLIALGLLLPWFPGLFA